MGASFQVYCDLLTIGQQALDKTLFLEVAKHLKMKKNPQGRHRENGEYMLTGKLFCGPCGSYIKEPCSLCATRLFNLLHMRMD